jgi:hypothetical protein
MNRKNSKQRAAQRRQRQKMAQAEYNGLVNDSIAANLQARGIPPAEFRSRNYSKKRRVEAATLSRSPFLDIDTFESVFIKRREQLDKTLDEKDTFQFSNLSLVSKVNHDIIALCRIAYRNYGIVANVVDLMSNFASKFEIYHSDPKWRQFYRGWKFKTHLTERLNTFIRDMLVHGVVFIYRGMATISPNDKRAMRKAPTLSTKGKKVAYASHDSKLMIIHDDKTKVIDPDDVSDLRHLGSVLAKDLGEDPKVQENRIPWSYTSLNSLQIEPTGKVFEGHAGFKFLLKKEDLAAFGISSEELPSRGITSVRRREVTNKVKEQQSDQLPADFENAVTNVSDPFGLFDLQVELPMDRMYVIYDKKFDWDLWGIPFIYRTLKNIKIKEILRTMEARAAQSFIASLLLIKLGHIDKDGNILSPPEGAVDDVAELIKTQGESGHLIWGTPDIDASFIQPDLTKIFDRDKMEGVDADILADLGASEVVVNGRGGGNYSNAFLSVASMLERLEVIREQFKTWLTNELHILAKAVGDTKMPHIRFDIKSLRDERIQNDFMLRLLQMNVISRRSMLEYAKIDPDTEMEEVKREDDQVKRGELPDIKSPFKNDLDNKIKEEFMREDDDGPLPSHDEQVERGMDRQKQVEQQTNPNSQDDRGRPTGTEKPQSVQRHTKPKGMGYIEIDKDKFDECRNYAQAGIRAIEIELYREALATSEIDSIEELHPSVRQRVRQMTEVILSQTAPGTDITRAYVKKMYTEAPAKLDSCVKDVMKEKLASFRKRNGKAPSAAQRKKMLSSAFAICNASVKK